MTDLFNAFDFWTMARYNALIIKTERLARVRKWEHKHPVRVYDPFFVTNPSGRDVKVNSRYLDHEDSDAEWVIFRILIGAIVTQMEKDGWVL